RIRRHLRLPNREPPGRSPACGYQPRAAAILRAKGHNRRQSPMEPLSSDSVKSAYYRRNRSLRAQLRMRQPELWLLGAVLLIAALLLIFVSIAEEVFEGETAAFDRNVVLAFRTAGNIADPIGPPW